LHALAVLNHKENAKVKYYFLAIAMLAFVLSACGTPATLTPEQTISPADVIMSTNTPFPVIPMETPSPQVLESTPVQTNVNDAAQSFSSDRLGLCFSYPEGYTLLPYEDTMEIIGPELPSPDLRVLFWIEKSDAYDRTAEVIADQDMTAAGLPSVGRSFVTLDGEDAVVLDGMPGQDFQRRVYVVDDQTLYVLAFMPTLSENQAASDQLETLYAAVMNSWKWSPCSASE
jgi:hypothetical protein